jgi:hypothetical protein
VVRIEAPLHLIEASMGGRVQIVEGRGCEV